MLDAPDRPPVEIEFAGAFHEAIEAFGLFAPDHTRCRDRLQNLIEVTARMQRAYGGDATIGLAGEDLVAGTSRFRPRERGLVLLREKLSSANVRYLRLAAGVEKREFLALIRILLRKTKSEIVRDIARELKDAGIVHILCEDAYQPPPAPKADARRGSLWDLVRRLDEAPYRRVLEAVRGIQRAVRDREIPSAYPVRAAVEELLSALIERPDEVLALVFRPQRDDWLLAHAVRSCILALRLGILMTDDKTSLSLLAESMLFNDVGLFGIAPRILYKRGPLSDSEQTTVKSHTIDGAAILLTGAGFSPAAVEAALLHHADQLGNGYPPINAETKPSVTCKIVRVVDAYECMIGGRPYRAPLSPFAAAAELLRGAGSQFDAALAAGFVEAIGFAPAGSLATLSRGGIAEVVHHNPHDLLRPTVRLIADEDGTVYPSDKTVDLATSRGMSITGTLPISDRVEFPFACAVD